MSSSISAPAPPAGAFIKSKWETVDPEQVSRSFDCITFFLVILTLTGHSNESMHSKTTISVMRQT